MTLKPLPSSTGTGPRRAVRSRLRRQCVAAATALLILAANAAPALAHGAGDSQIQLSSVPVGAYLVSVWTYPASPRAGEFHFDVRVTDFLYNLPAQNCEVSISVQSAEGSGASASTPAVGVAYPNDYMYEGRLKLMEPGLYRVTISVADEAGTAGQAGFDLGVQSVWLFKSLTLLFTAQLIPITLWLAYEARTVWLRRPRPVEEAT